MSTASNPIDRKPEVIVILGWGSLIWDPRELPCQGEWHRGGPVFPIEFSRISSDCRLTLVIDPTDGAPIPTRFVRSRRTRLEDAICDLRQREGTLSERIGFVNRANGASRCNVKPDLAAEILTWSVKHDIDGVVWTDLPPNFEGERDVNFSVEEAEKYLKGLPTSAAKRAREYINKAPAEVNTPLRRRMKEAGWLEEPKHE